MAGDGYTTTRLIDGPIESVFRAWTDPETLMRWWGPPDSVTPVADLDVRPGGNYRIVMRAADASRELEVTGTYREVDPPRRLVFSWRWSRGGPDAIESLVTLELEPRGERTELSLTHSGFPDPDAAAPYGAGWDHSLPGLAALF